MDPDRYAFEQAMSLRDDWQFSRIFAPDAARPGFTALLGLRAEMQHLLASTTEPEIAGVKFEWWRGEIERGFAGEAQHPLARALGTHLKSAGSAPEYCLELVDAAETEFESGVPFDEQNFQLYLYRSGGVLAEQLALLAGSGERRVLDVARRLGQLKRFNDLLVSLGAMLRAGRWLFPAGWLDEHGLNVHSLRENGADHRVAPLLRGMLTELDQERVAVRTAMQDVALPPALHLQWALAQHDYSRFRDRPESLLAERSSRSSVRRLWISWRAARAAATAHRNKRS